MSNTILIRGALPDGRPIAFHVPKEQVAAFIPELVKNSFEQPPPKELTNGIEFVGLDALLEDGRPIRFWSSPKHKEMMVNAMIAAASAAIPEGRGGSSGASATLHAERAVVNVGPCNGCGGTGQKTLGLVSLAQALISGPASDVARAVRDALCNACHDKDSKGERLFRLIDGVAYCGKPRDLLAPSTLYRDEKEEGCGCALHGEKGKQAFKASECPKGYWGAEK